MAFWIQVLSVFLRALLPVIREQAQDTAEDAVGPGELEEQLWKKIRQDGW